MSDCQTRTGVAAAGFTLLELTLALALTSLLTLVAYASLNLSIKAVSRGQVAAEVLQELRVGQSIMTRSLSSAARSSMDTRPHFVGDRYEVRFFTPQPLEAHSLGGLYHWRLLVGEDETGQLVLAVEQTKDVNWYRDPEGVEVRQIILGNLAEAHFSYGRGDRESESWDAKRSNALPDWVRVHLSPKGHEPQVWLIPIHVAEFSPAFPRQ